MSVVASVGALPRIGVTLWIHGGSLETVSISGEHPSKALKWNRYLLS